MLRNFRKPLVVASPKGLLRLPVDAYLITSILFLTSFQAASSSLADMERGTSFQSVIDDDAIDKAAIQRVVILAGKLYYDLVKERQIRRSNQVAFIRIEELCPFPFETLSSVLAAYKAAEDFVWLQEEPQNQGAWSHVAPRINAVLRRDGRDGPIRFSGRRQDSVPAPGITRLYATQQREVIESAFVAV